ncbi:MAG: hypothetical protein JJ863_11795 [Deltaproteobacteria bacterium]|nr:hypothetical protein [Deltaproteobacteria bacterium]
MSRSILRALVMAAMVLSIGCGDDGGDRTGEDAGPGDMGPPMPVSCETDVDCPDTYCNPGSLICCLPADPPFEICGDGIDQNCDRMDGSCGDNDGDGVQACRPGENPVGSGCDCDDERADVRPPFGDIAGATEVCDGADNDCNGRADESAACCEGCDSLGENRDRADVCTEAGACVCSTGSGTDPCAEGQTCCSTGCVDVQTDAVNCGFCGAVCTGSSDRCVGGTCGCGDGPPCDLNYECLDGVCQTP